MFRIRLDKISKEFGEFIALRDFVGEVPEGAKIALLGHNGAGKSTLLNIAAGLTKPSRGSVTYYDKDQELTDSRDVRRRLTYLSHEPMLYPDLTAVENLRFTARLYGVTLSESRLDELLRMVGMERAKTRLFRTCSRGMQQRLSLARALLPDPRLLLLDEPFSGLDQDGIARMMKLLAERGWVMVTHDLRLSFQMADEFWVLRRGKLAHAARKADLDFDAFMALANPGGVS